MGPRVKHTGNEAIDGKRRHSVDNFEAVLAHAMKLRPIKPKSLIMTIFGDSVVPRGGVIWLGSIVKLAAEFGVDQALVRTSALRLVNDGWLVRQQSGKLSYYSMTAEYVAADAAYRSQIYSTSDELRRNGWTIFRMFGNRLDRKTIYKLRKTLTQSGFGQLAPLIFIHPSIAKSAVRHIISTNGKGNDAGIAFFAKEMDQSPAMMRQLVSTAWDLDEVRKGYGEFISSFEDLPTLLEKEAPAPPIAFALRTLMVHQFRRLALRDPRLPEDIFAIGWPGERAFRLIRAAYAGLLVHSEAYLDQMFQAEGGIAPAADGRLFERFSGAL